jgi:hypothetical protein
MRTGIQIPEAGHLTCEIDGGTGVPPVKSCAQMGWPHLSVLFFGPRPLTSINSESRF